MLEMLVWWKRDQTDKGRAKRSLWTMSYPLASKKYHILVLFPPPQRGILDVSIWELRQNLAAYVLRENNLPMSTKKSCGAQCLRGFAPPVVLACLANEARPRELPSNIYKMYKMRSVLIRVDSIVFGFI